MNLHKARDTRIVQLWLCLVKPLIFIIEILGNKVAHFSFRTSIMKQTKPTILVDIIDKYFFQKALFY